MTKKPLLLISFSIISLLGACGPADAVPIATSAPLPTHTVLAASVPASASFVWVLDHGATPFQNTADIAITSDGYLYVADATNQIQKFDLDGNFILAWGEAGSEQGQFNFTDVEGDTKAGLAVDDEGNVFVADNQNQRVQIFDAEGNFRMEFGSSGQDDGQFLSPLTMDIAADGSIYVIDDRRNDIQVFNPSGSFLFKWGGFGTKDGRFYNVGDLTIAGEKVYVADYQNQRIQIFDLEGNFLTKWGSLGEGDYEFESPCDIGIDAGGNIYVTNYTYHETTEPRVQVFNKAGEYLFRWGSRGGEPGQFQNPCGIAIDFLGFVYVADYGNSNVQKFEISRD